MKYLFSILFLSVVFSCNQPSVVIEKESIKNTKFELFLKDFIKKNPNYLNNQNTIKETSKIFKKDLINFFKNNDSIFYDHPLQLSKTSEDGKFGLFRIWGTDEIKEEGREKVYQDQWYVDVLLRIPKTQIDTLVEKSYYRIIGKFNRYVKENDSEFNLSQSWTFEPDISKSEIGTETLKFNIGCLNLKPIKIEKINGDKSDGDYYKLRISNQ
jgi:hypothetical protein